MRLIKLSNGMFRVVDNRPLFEGPVEFAKEYLMLNCSITESEIDFALAELIRLGCDTAEFGILKGEYTNCFNSAKAERSLIELRALEDAKHDFLRAYKRNPLSQDTHRAAEALKTMWIILDTRALIDILEHGEQKGVPYAS